MTTLELLKKTRGAWGSLRNLEPEAKNRLLLAMADSLEAHSGEILTRNAADMAAAKGRISDVMLDRTASGPWPPCLTPWAGCWRSSTGPMA